MNLDEGKCFSVNLRKCDKGWRNLEVIAQKNKKLLIFETSYENEEKRNTLYKWELNLEHIKSLNLSQK